MAAKAFGVEAILEISRLASPTPSNADLIGSEKVSDSMLPTETT